MSKPGSRRQIFISQQEAELLIASLDLWNSCLCDSYMSKHHKAAGVFTSRRIDELLERLKKVAEKP